MDLCELPHFFTESFMNHGAQQCKEACHQAISKEYQKQGWVYERPSTALASSAVDAMFIHRSREHDYDLGPSHGGPGESQFTGKAVGASGNKGNRSHQVNTQEFLHEHMINKPLHLPSLVETLVGTQNLSNDQDRARSKGIRPEVVPARYPSEELKAMKEMTAAAGDQSVAMVAAAAAVAVLSDSEEGKRTRSYTMKAFNAEWDEALRWISSWGQSQNGYTGNSSRVNQGDSAGSRAQRHERNGKERTERQDQSRILTQLRFDQLLERCIKECPEQNSPNQGGNGEGYVPLKRVNPSIGFELFSALDARPKMMLTPNSRRVTSKIVGILLSSAILWLIRTIIDWWKLNRYSTSLQRLLEEESSVTHPKNAMKQGKHAPCSKKRKKKKGRNREACHQSQSLQSQTLRVESTSTRPGEGEGWDKFEEDSDSDDSFERMYLLRESPHRRSNTLDSNSDQASRGTISTVSCITMDSIQTHYTDTTKQTSKERIQKSIKRGKLEDNSFSHKHGFVRMDLPVPSQAQREEAARKLKAFQSSQVMKIIAKRKAEQNRSVQAQGKMSMRDAVVKNLPKSTKTDNLATNASLLPPPGFAFEEDTSTDAFDTQQEAEANFVGWMVSSILDEDEGAYEPEKQILATKQFTSSTNSGSGETKAIALGDLLVASSFGDSGNGTYSLKSSHNPWISPSLEAKAGSLDDGLGNLGDVNADANRQLQVSAREFMPSWGKEESDTQLNLNTKIW